MKTDANHWQSSLTPLLVTSRAEGIYSTRAILATQKETTDDHYYRGIRLVAT